MKKIFTFSAFALMITVLLAACIKGDYHYSDERYWLSRERGEVVYSSSTCNYYVIGTYNGYTIVRAWGGYKPYEGSIVYGDLSYRGTRDMYNYSSGVVFTGTVTDTHLTYFEAQDALNYYCPLGLGQVREFKKTTQ